MGAREIQDYVNSGGEIGAEKEPGQPAKYINRDHVKLSISYKEICG